MRVLAIVVGLVLLFGASVAHAQAEPAPSPAATPATPATATPNRPAATTIDAPPQLSAPPPSPLWATPPRKRPPAQALPEPQAQPRWVKPVFWVLLGGAIGFAAASIAVVSSGSTSDEQRVDLAAGLGAGFIACALGGVIIQFAVH